MAPWQAAIETTGDAIVLVCPPASSPGAGAAQALACADAVQAAISISALVVTCTAVNGRPLDQVIEQGARQLEFEAIQAVFSDRPLIRVDPMVAPLIEDRDEIQKASEHRFLVVPKRT